MEAVGPVWAATRPPVYNCETSDDSNYTSLWLLLWFRDSILQFSALAETTASLPLTCLLPLQLETQNAKIMGWRKTNLLETAMR